MASLRALVTVCCAAALVLGAVPAVAQEDDGARVELTLLEQPVWHETGDRLGLKFRVANRGDEELGGFMVTVAAHSRVLSRSELHQSFEAAPTFQASLIQVEVPGGPIPAGEAVDITVDPALAELQSLATATESGVYPLTVTLFDQGGTTVLDTVTTPLIYYPGKTELALNVALLIPINDIPRRAPDGTFPAEQGRWPLDAAVSEGGWLRGLVAALEATTGPQPRPPDDRPPRRSRRGRARRPREPLPRPEPLHVGIAPVPRLIEELADMRDGYTRSDGDVEEGVGAGDQTSENAGDVLDRLAALLGTRGVQPITTPYSFPDLPALDESPVADDLITQIDEGQTVLNDALGTRPDRTWIFPPGGRVEASTLEYLQRGADADGAHTATFLAEESLEPMTEDPAGGGCPTATLSFTCPISVRTSVDTSRGYALDPSIQQRLFEVASGEDVRLAVQRFFAELSAIREETPGQPGRIVAATLPGLWAPRPSISRVILAGLRDAPWIRTVTPKEGFAVARDLVETRARVIRTSLPPIEDAPAPDYFEELYEAREELEHFATVGPPASFVQRLTRNILTGESRLWWANDLEEEGRAYASESLAEVEAEKDKITIGSTSEINLTSRTAPVQIAVFNDASYPVRVRVHLSSPELGLERTFEETVQARGLRQVRFDVEAQTSGIFELLVELETPDGHSITDPDNPETITIRSTEFNEIALGLTFGALAFLVLFYITRTLRQRRHPEQAEA